MGALLGLVEWEAGMNRVSGIVRGHLIAVLALTAPSWAASSSRVTALNQGGPDGYGYRYIDNISESTGPIHQAVWMDISSTGTVLPLGLPAGDSSYTTFTVPILVRMYGLNFGTPPSGSGISAVSADAEVSANGFVALLGQGQQPPGAFPGLGMYANTTLPSANNRVVPGGFIAACWDGWGARGANDSAQWEVIGSAPNRRLVIQWTNWSYAASTEDMTFQVQITESNGQVDSDIYITYRDVTTAQEAGNSATIGIQGGPAPAPAMLYSFNNAPLANPTNPDSSTNPATPRTIVFYTGPTPPQIGVGTPPNPPTNIQQIGSFGITAQGDWTATSIAFQANISDPDLDSGSPQQVALEARYRKVGNANWTTVSSGNSPQGTVGVSVNLTTVNPEGNYGDGNYDWEYRARDTFFRYWPSDPNGIPLWQPFQGNAVSPDFRSDQLPASPPTALEPSGIDLSTPFEFADQITFTWIGSVDNGPSSAIRYEIQVSRDDTFSDIETTASHIAATSASLSVTVSRFTKYWRVRSTDIGGNVSSWSTVRQFRLTFDDQVDHASGDAKKNCGFSVASTGTSAIAWLIVVLAGLLVLKRRR